MNLTACENCGVVLNKDILPFPELRYDHYDLVMDDFVVWTGTDFVSSCLCPVCKNKILE